MIKIGLTSSTPFILDLTMRRKLDGMMSLGCFTVVVIVFIKCSLVATTKELEVGPKITSIADEVKEQLEKSTGNE